MGGVKFVIYSFNHQFSYISTFSAVVSMHDTIVSNSILLLVATVRFAAVAVGCAGSFVFCLEIMVDSDDEVMVEEDPPDAQAESYIWKYFVDVAQYGTRGGSKNSQCMFCDRSFTGISTTRAVSHILGRPVMGQSTAGIKGCIALKNKEEDRGADLKKARDELGGIIREKEAAMNSKKRKQVVMDSLLVPRSKQSPAATAKKSNKKHLDLAVARFFFENAIPFNVASSSLKKAWPSAFKTRLNLIKLQTARNFRDSFLLSRLRANETGQRMDTSTPRFATSWSLQPRRSWSMCMRTARSCPRLEPVASSKCLLGILKKLTTKNACAVRARAEAHKTYSSIAQVPGDG